MRLENGEQPPRLKTMKAVAGVQSVDAPDLLIDQSSCPDNPPETADKVLDALLWHQPEKI